MSRCSGVVFGSSKMSDSSNDSDWTFLSGVPEVNEEIQNDPLDTTECNKSDVKEERVDVVMHFSFDEDKVTFKREKEELDDDFPAVSSESESLPSSDVDVLEDSVGPDHDMFHVSSLSNTSSFSILNPLEGTSLSYGAETSSLSLQPPPQTKQANAEISDTIGSEYEEPLPGVSVESPKCNTHLVQSSKTPDNLSHPKSEEPLPGVFVESPKCNTQLVQSSKTPDNLSHPKSEEPVQEQDSEQKSMKRKKRLILKAKKHRYRKEIPQDVFVEIHEIFSEVLAKYGVAFPFFVVWSFIFFVVSACCLMPYFTSDKEHLSRNTAAHLKFIQDETLKCLGLQHLTAVENNHFGMLMSYVCINDSVALKSNFEKLLEDKVLKTLISKVYNETSVEKKNKVIEGFMSEARNDVQGIKFDLLLRQLEYLKLLPPVEDDHGNEKHEDSAASYLFSEKLEEQEQLLSQLHQLIDQLKMGNFALKSSHAELKTMDRTEDSTDPVALKSKIHRLELENTFLCNQLQHVLDQFESGEFLDPQYWMELSGLNNVPNSFKGDRMEELLEKVNSLLPAFDELRMIYSHFSDAKLEIKDGDKKGTSAAEGETTSKQPGFSETGIENLESLVKELLDLRKTFTDELIEVRRWNDMLSGITDELESTPAGKSTDYWIWPNFKHAFNGMLDVKLDLAQKLKNIKNIDVSDFKNFDISSLFQERRPFIKDVFQSIKNFWKDTGSRSREFIEKALHEMNTEFSLSGMFSSVMGHEDLPEGSEASSGDITEKNQDHEAKNFQDDMSSTQKNTVPNPDVDVSGLPETVSPCRDQADFDSFKANWLFKRAADRESLRHASKRNPVNWYLRREQNMWRSPMTKEQIELLERMDVAQYPSLAKSHSRESDDHKA